MVLSPQWQVGLGDGIDVGFLVQGVRLLVGFGGMGSSGRVGFGVGLSSAESVRLTALADLASIDLIVLVFWTFPDLAFATLMALASVFLADLAVMSSAKSWKFGLEDFASREFFSFDSMTPSSFDRRFLSGRRFLTTAAVLPLKVSEWAPETILEMTSRMDDSFMMNVCCYRLRGDRVRMLDALRL
jgi:hypothetical protein